MTAVSWAGTGGSPHVKDDGECDNRKVTMTAKYDTAHPYSWFMTFQLPDQEKVPWEFGRDLMLAALDDHGFHGDMDVVVVNVAMPAGDTLVFNLESPDGFAQVVTPAAPLFAFVRQSLLLVPAGTESVDVDDAITRILAGEGAA